MRRAYNNSEMIFDEKQEFLGISLGYDFCAEHEWGIRDIKRMFGMPTEPTKKNIGIAYRTITKFEDENHLFKEYTIDGEVFTALICSEASYKMNFYKEANTLNDELKPREDRGFQTAWSSSEFGIAVSSKYKHYLTELYEAFKKKDICIGVFGRGVFGNSSLTIAIKSKMSKDVLDQLKESDTNSIRLRKITKKLNLEDKARKSGRQFVSISHRFIEPFDESSLKEEKKKRNTKYDVWCWVNGSNDNYGWFTVEEVKKWIKNPDVANVEEFKNRK